MEIPFLHPFQSSAIEALRHPKIHLALTAPTGAGKGVILERIAEDPGERILLLTPLIALGRQQARRFRTRGIPTRVSLGGEKKILETRPRVWISSPESALVPRRSEEIKAWKPTLVAVDEAHCIAEWGENFRPAYGQLTTFLRFLGVQRSLWMSATFPRRTVDDLAEKFPGPWKTEGSFAVPENLVVALHRISPPDRIELIREKVLAFPRPGILFAGTRKNVELYRALFAREGRTFVPYHAGLSDEERRVAERRLETDLAPDGAYPSIVATNAFGMGMDYPRLEWMISATIPYSLLGLMQAFGRVGRAGKKGSADLYWAEEDFRFAGYFGGDQPTGKTATDLARLRDYLEASADGKNAILREEFL